MTEDQFLEMYVRWQRIEAQCEVSRLEVVPGFFSPEVVSDLRKLLQQSYSGV
jgi:hypothetical protein